MTISADRVFAIAVLVISTAYLIATYNLPPLLIQDAVGPKVFPTIIGGAAAVLALMLLAKSLRESPLTAEGARAATALLRQPPVLLIGAMAWTTLYYWVFTDAGFILATVAYMFGLTSVFNAGRWKSNALVSLCFPLAIYAVFVHALQLSLPNGLLPVL